MREIKFRAWDKTGNCMVDWSCMMQTAFNDDKASLLYDIFCGRRLNTTLMQYTGLKDKNGKEIYEGDILKHNPDDDDWNDSVLWWDEKARFELASLINFPLKEVAESYKDDLLTLRGLDPMERAKSNRDCTMFNLSNIVSGADNPSLIIGNIHENPELLEP